eukprot:3778333-Prymnesium_polylepis.1
MMLCSAARVAARITSLVCPSRTRGTADESPRAPEMTGPTGATCRAATRRPVSSAGRHQLASHASGAAHSPAPATVLDELPDAEVDALAGRTKEGATPRLPCCT